jgi:subtilisin family serine protease
MADAAPEPDPHGISPDDRYIVRIQDQSGRRSIAAVGGRILFDLDPATVAAQLTPAQREALAGQPGIEELEVDPRRYPLGGAEQVPYGVTMVQADRILSQSSDQPVTVCVIDSGYSAQHEDLPTNVTGTADSGTGAWNVDACGHGTHVAGTIAALKNDLGVVGVAPDAVRLHIVKVFGDNCAWTYSSSLVRAVYECVRAGSQVINMSLGGPTPYWFEELAFEWAYLKGVLPIAAAGNAGNTTKSYPAGYEHVVSVAAVNSQAAVASFSQKNDDVELAAPGVAVLSTIPDGGRGTYSAWSGTSMATPHVAGTAALIWSKNRGWSNAQVRQALQQTAFDVWPQGRDSSSGFGVVQAGKALRWLESGSGSGSGESGSSGPVDCAPVCGAQ